MTNRKSVDVIGESNFSSIENNVKVQMKKPATVSENDVRRWKCDEKRRQ